MTDTILLAGATGMLGGRVAHHLARLPGARLRVLARAATDARLAPLLATGAEVVEGDLADPASLDCATQGVDMVVSAVQGGREVIVDGQVALVAAAHRNGAWRILPSDYALDLFKATPGEHASFDLRREADAAIAQLGLDQVNVLQGGFMMLFMPGMGAIDLEKGTVVFWGDGEALVEVTSVEDTARMIARVATDRTVLMGKFAFAGDRISFREAGRVIGQRLGRTLTLVPYGSEADLRAAMAVADPHKRVMLAFLYMLNGQTALTDVQNDRYPDLRLETFADFVAHELPAQAA